MSKLRIVHLYPEEMNIYGDRGNVLALTQRLAWRGIESEVVPVGVGDTLDLARADIVFGGGGQDKGQIAVSADLLRHQKALQEAADGGLPMLLICGLYQLFGHEFRPATGEVLQGIGVFDAVTKASDRRLIGNVVVDSTYGKLVGFENHSGRTTLVPGQAALGRVVKGQGNDGESGHEGAVYRNVIGTYLHGSLLPKNPQLADHLLLIALQRKYGADFKLAPLDDELEHQAADVAAQRPA